MIETLVFWALALYGAMILVFQAVRRLQSRKRRWIHTVSLVLIVQDGESEIEGILRGLSVWFSLDDRLTSIHVLDISIGDETEQIVRRLALKQPRVTYRRVDSKLALAEWLQKGCLHESAVGYVYDLRTRGILHDIANDLAAILR